MIAQVASRLTLALVATILLLAAFPAAGMAACANPVACENEKPGSAPSAWQISGAGDASIQGYATSMSVNKGGTIRFKIKTTASNYHIDIYRLGYYQGNGARLQAAGIRPTATLAPDPAQLPDDRLDGPDRLRELGRVGVVDGPGHLGVRRLHRTPGARRQRRREPDPVRGARRRGPVRHPGQDLRRDVAGLQQVRRQQPVLVHLAVPARQSRGYKGAFSVSYNRPFDGTIAQDIGRSYLFYAEYQMIRFIERNGYDASYISQPDVAANRRAPAQPQADHLERARRVLVRARTTEHRGRARRRREPGLLQRQRGVLEDALAVQQRRRHHDAEPDADHLQGHALRRGDRPGGVDGHLGRPALQRAGRRRASRRTRSPASSSSSTPARRT